VSLLTAVPRGAQRTYRMDLATPLRGPAAGAIELRFSATNRTRAFWNPPEDVERARAAAIPQRIFAWP